MEGWKNGRQMYNNMNECGTQVVKKEIISNMGFIVRNQRDDSCQNKRLEGKSAPILVHCRVKVIVNKVFSSLTASLCYRLYFILPKYTL